MKHPLNSTFEFMPDKDLRLFILHQVITPFLDQKAVEGVRLSAGIDYKAETQIVHGPRFDRKGKTTEVLVMVVCRQNSSGLSQSLLSIEIVPTGDASADFASYAIHGVLRKDDRGYYLTESTVRTLK
ncbi:MAG: hypothetical protein K9N47_08990 [Prosthecobacter sp.]|uniref:hypothetical protein n=1 Tax=Prosthecobacter sp. TaxID=1965333 RepID=UPI0025E44892|nr:hypothetical protein [Prosthecobacter sp.]MCF7786246.1 hypothetical protein [Prosthecobacter sp.]